MELTAKYEEGTLFIKTPGQDWIIGNIGHTWTLFIPRNGDEPQFVGNYNSFTEAYESLQEQIKKPTCHERQSGRRG